MCQSIIRTHTCGHQLHATLQCNKVPPHQRVFRGETLAHCTDKLRSGNDETVDYHCSSSCCEETFYRHILNWARAVKDNDGEQSILSAAHGVSVNVALLLHDLLRCQRPLQSVAGLRLKALEQIGLHCDVDPFGQDPVTGEWKW